jgi:gamma-glutamyltranspeptidase/glutathione hydrolase
VVLPQILGLLERTGALDRPPMSPDRLHLFAEASRLAFADRNAHLGDPAGLAPGLAGALIDPAYLDRRAAGIDRRRATPSAEVDAGRPESASTTNLCVVDAAGGAVALTYTLNTSFGTHRMAAGTGVLWNNEMDDFAAKPGEPNHFGLRQGAANAIVPGRRPLSSMSPTIVTREGRVVLALGSPGGPRILSAVALVLLRHVGDGLPLDVAVLAPRVHHQHLPDRLDWEWAAVTWPRMVARPDLVVTDGSRDGLRRRGHELRAVETSIGDVTAIAVDAETGRRTGVADGRGYGRAARERPDRWIPSPRINRLPR